MMCLWKLLKGITTEIVTYLKASSNAHRLVLVYTALAATKSCFTMFLHLIQLTAQRRISNETLDPDTREQYKKVLKIVYDIMIQTGAIHREMGVVGMMLHTVYTVFPVLNGQVIHNYIKRINLGKGLLAFIEDQQSELSNINSRLEQYLASVIESNENFKQTFAHRMRLELVQAATQRYYNMASIEMHYKRLFISAEHGQQQKHDEQQENDTIEFNTNTVFTDLAKLSNDVQLNNMVTRQSEYLERLMKDKSDIWPSNRRDRSYINRANYFIKSYMLISILFWTFGQIMVICFNYLAYKSLYPKLTLLDRLSMVENHLFVLFLSLNLGDIGSYLIACVLDQRDFRNSLHNDYETLKKQLDQLYRIELYFHKTITFNKYHESILHELRCEYNRKALETYISVKIFFHEGPHTISYIQHSGNTLVYTGACILIINLISIRTNESLHLKLLALLWTITILSTNAILLTFAALNGNSLKFTKLIWSLIAQSESYNDDHSPTNGRLSIEAPLGTESKSSQSDRNNGNLKCNQKITIDRQQDEVVYCITPQTSQLWRRFMQDEESVSNRISCKLLDVFRIDYRFILRLNFWLLSLMMLVLTNKF